MRILFAADLKPDPNSGAAGTEYQTIQALRGLGHEVDCIWSDDLRHWVRHWNLHYLMELPRAYRDAIRARCRRQSYDVIHVNQPYAWLAAQDHRQASRPGVFVNRSHGWEPCMTVALEPWRRKYRVPEWSLWRGVVGRPLRWVLEGVYPRWVARWSDGIIVSSRLDRDWVCRGYRLPLSQVAVIHQAPSPFFLAAPAVPMTAERLRRVLYVGQFAFFKAPYVVAAAFNQLAAQRPGLALTWCCADGDHEKARSLLSPKAREAVRFVGWMPQESLSPLYDNYGVLLFPSFYEGFGKVFLEAMARGMCVVASDVGGARDIITQGTDGLRVPPGDARALVEAVCTVQGNLSLAQSMSARARETARLHTWERVARETLSFYASLSAANAATRVA